jgi:hypothetical protein
LAEIKLKLDWVERLDLVNDYAPLAPELALKVSHSYFDLMIMLCYVLLLLYSRCCWVIYIIVFCNIHGHMKMLVPVVVLLIVPLIFFLDIFSNIVNCKQQI